MTPVICVLESLVTVSNESVDPPFLTKVAVDPIEKLVPVIVNVWLPVPSPDTTLVGETDEIVGVFNLKLLLKTFLSVPEDVS